MTPPLRLIGLVELADMLDADRGTVRQWYHRGKLPPPDAVLAVGPIWRESTVTKSMWYASGKWRTP